jgi:hypothetical protein
VLHLYGNYRELGSVYQVKPGFVVVSADVERANPVRTTRNTILDDAHRFVGVRNHKSIFHFGFSQRPWLLARHTSLDCLGHHFANGYQAVPLAGTLASHWSASGALASVYDVSVGSGVLAESSRLPVDSLRC